MMQCNTTSSISKLPTELLSRILTLVHNDSNSGVFLACLLCCRYWNDVALPILYRDVFLYNATINLFTAALTHHNAASIRLLTICINPIRLQPGHLWPRPTYNSAGRSVPEIGHTEDPGLTRIWQDIQKLGPCLKELTSLTTFSLRFMWSGDDEIASFRVKRIDLYNILQAIPASCRSLELDTRRYDRYEYHLDGHVCEGIRNLIPQLQHLRLRSYILCPTIFGEGSIRNEGRDLRQADVFRQLSNLQTVLINTTLEPSASTTVLCRSYSSEPQHPRPLAHHVMSTSARRLLELGAFPAIQKFGIIGNETSKHRMTPGWRAIFDYNDIISNDAYVQLVQPLGRGLKGYLLRPHNGEVIFGSYPAIEDVAEGVSWLETTNGSRFPSSFALTPDAINAGYKWKRPVVENQAFTNKRGSDDVDL